MTPYQIDLNVCPASLGEDDTPIDPENTAHRWDDTICAECGAQRQEVPCICAACGNEHTRPQD